LDDFFTGKHQHRALDCGVEELHHKSVAADIIQPGQRAGRWEASADLRNSSEQSAAFFYRFQTQGSVK
jgi:hypothetical protein